MTPPTEARPSGRSASTFPKPSWLACAAASDVNSQGWGRVQDARLYQPVRQPRSVADRTIEIEFFDTGPRAYVFTFG
jgi:hypothetical protein